MNSSLALAPHSVILIPARYASTRFPGKPLALIKGRPMIEWVYEKAKKTKVPTYVVTDHPAIEQCVRGFGGECLMIPDDTNSGTDRLWLAYKRFSALKNASIIINVQGDEPLLKTSTILRLINTHLKIAIRKPKSIMTLVRPRMNDLQDFNNPNIVKVIYDPLSLRCLYFSRASIPYSNPCPKEFEWYQHIGMYSYTPAALEMLCTAPVGIWEQLEKLEQLRALEKKIPIYALQTRTTLIGVDSPENISEVEKELL